MNYQICWKKHVEYCNEVIEELNKMRQKPMKYAPYIQNFIDNYEDECIIIRHVDETGDEEEVGIQLDEGKKCVSITSIFKYIHC